MSKRNSVPYFVFCSWADLQQASLTLRAGGGPVSCIKRRILEKVNRSAAVLGRLEKLKRHMLVVMSHILAFLLSWS